MWAHKQLADLLQMTKETIGVACLSVRRWWWRFLVGGEAVVVWMWWGWCVASERVC